MFGILSGVIWSAVPGTLSELFRSPGETATVIVAGGLAGVLVSLALKPVLARFGRWAALWLGILSLPFGAFAFGVFISLVQWLVREFTGVAYRFVEQRFNPFQAGAEYAVFSVISVFAIILFPLAVLTTFLLRAVIVSGHERVA